MAGENQTLEDLAPSVDDLLKKLASSPTFRAIKMRKNDLTLQEKSFLLDKERMPWDLLRKSLLEAIDSFKATSKGQLANRTKKYSRQKMDLWIAFSRNCPDTIDLSAEKKKIEWRSAGHWLAQEFTESLEFGLCRGVRDLQSEIETILASDTKEPEDKMLKETMYNIASWLVHCAKKAAKRKKGDIERGLLAFAESAGLAREDAIQDRNLPSGKVEREERHGGLCYASFELYKFVLKIDSVFSALLKQKNIRVLGGMAVANIRDILLASDLQFEQFFPDETDPSLWKGVLSIILESYGNMRGKDFARKYNARGGPNTTVQHRHQMAALVGTGAKKGKGKKGKKNKEETKTESAAATAAHLNETPTGGAAHLNDETSTTTEGDAPPEIEVLSDEDLLQLMEDYEAEMEGALLDDDLEE